jgi:hypothetical protein
MYIYKGLKADRVVCVLRVEHCVWNMRFALSDLLETASVGVSYWVERVSWGFGLSFQQAL